MKTIIENSTNISKYLFEDDKAIDIQADKINIGDPANLNFIIGDLNSENATLHEAVTNAPADWVGCKYLFDGTTWTENPDWVDPNLE